MTKRNESVTVVIPTLNEEKTIGKTLMDIPEEVVSEVIVVDCSTDDSPKIAESLGAKVIRESRGGYGRALQTGIENARGDIIVYIDGDYTYDPKEIPLVIHPILDEICDVVLGSRTKSKVFPRSMSRLHRLGNLIISLIFDILFLKAIGDAQTGFRAIRKQLLEGLTYENYGMAYVTEQLIKLIKRGAGTREVPTTYRPRLCGESKVRMKDGFEILKAMLKYRFVG